MEDLINNDYDITNSDFSDEDECDSNSTNERLATSSLEDNRCQKRKNSTESNSKYCKKRKCRTTFSKNQLNMLEKEFLNSNFVANDRIELIIELTGLDSRIIKNWFKNKRSRVLADTKIVLPSLAQILTNSNSKYEPKQIFIQTSNLVNPHFKENHHHRNNDIAFNNYQPQLSPQDISESGYAKINLNKNNSTGLLNMIYQKPTNKDQKVNEELEGPSRESICQTCSKINKLLCSCNVSKQALNKLYGYGGLNECGLNFLNSGANEVDGVSLLWPSIVGTHEMGAKTFEIL